MQQYLLVAALLLFTSITIDGQAVTVTVSGSGTPTEDRPFTLTCTVSGHQSLMATVTYQWSRSSGSLQGPTNGMTYTFNPIDRNDNGTYTCQVTISSPLLNNNILEQNSIALQVTVLQPGQPQNIRATSRGLTFIIVTWDAPSSGGRVDIYTVQYSASVRECNVPPQTGGPTSTGTQRSQIINNLHEDSDVTITIRAVNIRGVASIMFTTSTLTANPGMVQNLRSTGATFYSITVRWDELSCVDRNGELTGYRVEYGTTPTSRNMQTVTETSFTATGLLPQTTYLFRVAAVNSNGTGPYSTVVSRQTTANTVTVTVSGSGTPTEGSPFTLTCTVSGQQSLMATVTYQWSRSSDSLQGPTNGMTYTFNPIDRDDNGTYTCQVNISSPLLNSDIVEQDSNTLQVTVLLPATPVVSDSQGPTSITVTWDAPSSGGRVDSYTIQYRASVRGCSDVSRDVSPTQGGPTTISSNQRRFDITNLEEDSEVSVTITAVNIRGIKSTMVNTSTLTASPGMVHNLHSTNATFTSITLTWDELSCVDHNGELTGYMIEYGTTTFDSMETVTGTSFTATGLLPFTNYTFNVAAVNINGTGSDNSIVYREYSLPSKVILWHNESRVSNHSIVSLEGIRDGNELFCITNTSACCRDIHTGGMGARGHWYFPDGTEVTRDFRLRRFRGRSFVALTEANINQSPSGLYRCVIPDHNDQNATLFIGIYRNGQGIPTITAPIEYNFTSSTLTCISCGGPATTVTWTRDNVPISQSTSTQQQRLTDTSTATYHNLLTITSTNITDYSGTITCRAVNSRGSDTQSVTLRNELVISVIGNRIFQLGETTNISCSTPVPVQSIQWVDESNTVVRDGTSVQELELNIMITTSINNTRYRCAGGGFSEAVTIQVTAAAVGNNVLPRVPDSIIALSTETTIIISWAFTIMLDSRNEIITVMYGTTPGELRMVSRQVLSMPSIQRYSVQLASLNPATNYYFQLNSTNRFESVTTEVRNIKTMDAKSTVVRDVRSETPDNTTIVLTWQPPQPTNGDILNYIVRTALNFNNEIVVSEEVVTDTTLTVNLGTVKHLPIKTARYDLYASKVPGVPYDVSIIPVNLAGQGDTSTNTFFTHELTPNVEVYVVVERTSPTTMNVSWRPLTLSEARGFVTFYSIAYTPTPNSRRRQAPQDTMYMNASANSSSVTIQGLDGDLAYSVTVAGGTRAGVGVQSGSRVADKQGTCSCATGTEAIVGGVVAVVFILSITGIIIVLAILMKSRKSLYNTTVAAPKSDPDISKVSDEGPAYEVIAVREVEGKTSVTQHQSPEKSEEKFVLKECPAYGPVDTTGDKKTKAEDPNVYETVSSV